jgi:hypothetical protein
MPLYMDIHSIDGVTVDDVVNAHLADLQTQDRWHRRSQHGWRLPMRSCTWPTDT